MALTLAWSGSSKVRTQQQSPELLPVALPLALVTLGVTGAAITGAALGSLAAVVALVSAQRQLSSGLGRGWLRSGRGLGRALSHLEGGGILQDLLQGGLAALQELIPELVVGDGGEHAEDHDVVDGDASQVGLVPVGPEAGEELSEVLPLLLLQPEELEAPDEHGVDLLVVGRDGAHASVVVSQHWGGPTNPQADLSGDNVVQAGEEERLLLGDLQLVQLGGDMERPVLALELAQFNRC